MKKWKNLTRGGYLFEIWKQADGKIWGRVCDGAWTHAEWRLDGDYYPDNVESIYDLIEDKPAPRKFKCWAHRLSGCLDWVDSTKPTNDNWERIPEFDKELP